MNITLNDFRSILGKVNDGDVVFTRVNNERTGIEKANYGSLFTRNEKISSADDNAEMRKLFARVIVSASRQNRPTLSEDTLKAIRKRLGIGDDGKHEWNVITKPLDRREIKAILDIVDNASEQIKADNEKLPKLSTGIDMARRMEFERAVNTSPVLSGKNNLRTVIGRTFLGFKRSDIAKRVGKYLGPLKAMTLDEMTWHFQSTGNEMRVEDALRISIKKMMQAFGQGKMPLTRTQQLFAKDPAPVAFDDDNEHTVENFFKNHHLMPEQELAILLTESPAGSMDAFSRLVLGRTLEYVKNSFRKDFQECVENNGNSPQQAQESYDARTLQIRRTLEEYANDVRSIISADASNRVKFLSDLVKNLVDAMHGVDPTALGARGVREMFMAVLAKTVSPFSMRQMATDFVNESAHPDFQKVEFAYAYIDDFGKRVAALPPNSGFKANVAHRQSQMFLASRSGQPIPKLSGNLKNGTLESLYNEFKTAHEEADPEKLRQKRATRNRDAAIRVLLNVHGDAVVNGYRPALLEEYILGVYTKFYLSVHGNYSLKNEDLNDIPDEEANARVLEWIQTVSDDEIAFLEKFCSLDLISADRRLQTKYYELTNSKMQTPLLYAAFRDAGDAFKDVSKDSVIVLETFLTMGLIPLARDGGAAIGNFAGIMDVGPKDETRANCLAFVEKLQLEVNKGTGKTRAILTNAQKTAIQNANVPERETNDALAGTGYLDVKGFGTLDLLKIIKLLNRAGISLKDFSTSNPAKRTEACVRTLALMHFASFNNYDLDSLPEYIQRVTNKDVKEVSFSDYVKLLGVEEDKRDVVSADNAKVVDLLTGKLALSEAELSQGDIIELRRALAEIRKPDAKPVTINVMGKTLTLEMLPDGGVRASLKTGNKAGAFKLYRLSLNAVDFSRAIDDIIIANAKAYAKDVVKSVLPPRPNPAQGDSLMRAREVYAKTICSLAGKYSPVDYASVPTSQLRQLAIDAIDGKPIAAPNANPQTFNSAEMIEMHKTLDSITLAEVDAKVKFPVNAVRRSENSRRTTPPTGKEFRAIIADLFLNEDTWAFDAQVGSVSGERIRKLMLANAPELAFVFKDIPGYVNHLDESIRDKVKEILQKLKDIPADSLRPNAQGVVSAATMKTLADAEKLVDDLVKAYADSMQEKVRQLFMVNDDGDVKKPLQYQTFAEISGISALNPKTPEGKFTLNVLNSYFIKSAREDQRAMLAAMIRNTDNTSSNAKQVAELLKGAGPLLQKMLQGLPITSFNPETQLALKDMKSRLAPIPVDAVKAQLLELVNSSNGEILSIEVKKVLGAASVGEALLCHVKTKEQPLTGVDCVIKVLRPNIYTAVLREKAIFDEIIEQTVPMMKKPFNSRYMEILKEFDLTIETENIRLGRTHYEHPTVNGTSLLNVSSMDLVENVSPTTGTIVVKKAEGTTYDKYIDDIHAEADEVIGRIKPSAIQMNGRVTRPCSSVRQLLSTRRHLEYLKAFLGEKRNHISDFAHAWFENGLYGDGFMHGDLHAGNIMVSDKGATVIDFGNCIRMSKAEQDHIRNLVSKASIGYGEDAIKTFRNLLSDEAKQKLDAILADPQKESFRKNLFGVFTKGTGADVMARIYAAMNLLQREGVEIPGTVANFFQSFSRLNDIYQTMTDEMARIDAMIDTLVLDENELPQIGEGAPKIITDFMSFLGGVSSNPDKEFNFGKFAATANKFLHDSFDPIMDEKGQIYGGEENVATFCNDQAQALEEVRTLLKTDRAKFNATVLPFIEWLNKQEIPYEGIALLRKGPGNADAYGLAGQALNDLEKSLPIIKDENISPDSPEFQEAVSTFMEGLALTLQFFARGIGALMDPAPSTEQKFTGLNGVKMSTDKPVYAVCGEVVASKLANLSAFAKMLWTFMWDFGTRLSSVAVSLRENMRYSGKFKRRQEYAKETLEHGNDALNENLRLTTAKRRVLMRQMETFSWPFEGAWTENHVEEGKNKVKRVKVTFPEEKWPIFVEALSENLNILKGALGFAEGEKLPPEIARLAVTYLAQIDPRVSAAVKSLNEQQYNAFLVSLGSNPEANMLNAAVDALNKAPGDAQLFAAKPSAKTAFDKIDRKADKVEPSLAAFKNLMSNNDDDDDDDE